MKRDHELLFKLLWVTLHSMEGFPEKSFSSTELKRQINLIGMYDRWLEESLSVLVRQNYLQKAGEQYRIADREPVELDEAWQQWECQKGTWLQAPGGKAQLTLVEAMLHALPKILTGKTPATDIMFPNSSLERVEGIYKDNPVADYFNEALADAVAVYIEERLQQDPGARIRLLEVGAGTGGTSSVILERLKGYREQIEEYCYTDISKAFLTRAEAELGPQNPFLRYQLFNVEQPVETQGVPVAGYDLVIAANVLHATKNIRRTLRNLKLTLGKNGLLLLNEISASSLFTHLTFGLLEGWWLFEDPELRIPGCPGLTADTWRAVLESEGFRSVFFPVTQAHSLGQQIVIAESDGIIRQWQPRDQAGATRPRLRRDGPGKKTQLQLSKRGPNDPPPVAPVSAFADSDPAVEAYIRDAIMAQLSLSLKIQREMIDTDKAFADYGVDSITGVNLVQNINRVLQVDLQTTDIFDYQSVNQLARFILGTYQATVVSTGGVGVRQHDRVGEAVNSLPSTGGTELQRRRTLFWARYPKDRTRADAATGKKSCGLRDTFTKEPIAIIGMSGRFPKSQDVHELWEHLSRGQDLVEPVTRWDLSRYFSPETPFCNSGSFLDQIDQFDPFFFNISGLEATYMDPQQRIFLEEAWKAMEDAGYAGESAGTRCGVYVGCAAGDYQSLFGPDAPAQALWGYLGSVIPARISYYLNLKGPAVAIDTACSSSLVAVHLACQALWGGEVDLALAGGVYIHTSPKYFIAANRAGMLSVRGHCHSFDERADGMVPGEAAGAIVLKRLQDALADGDHIEGIIRGTGINQDGTTNGITAPSANSQENLECSIYDTFRINPERIQMVEAHGTGTKLGDPIEFTALKRAFQKYTTKTGYCSLGSIKSNLGHTQLAAGITGITKVLLALQHKKHPPALHFESENAQIQFANSPFYINPVLKEWVVEPGAKRCAAISSFGAGGTNAHLVIEEGPDATRQRVERPGYLLVLSARTPQQLRQAVERLAKYCEEQPVLDGWNMSFTLFEGRRHFSHRFACIWQPKESLAALLNQWLTDGKAPGIYSSDSYEKPNQEQITLKRYGNQCIQNCRDRGQIGDYLENLGAIAELYVQGYKLDFQQLFTNEACHRISLPTYPFAKERYWVPEAGQTIAAVSMPPGNLAEVEGQNTEIMTFEEVWQEARLENGGAVRVEILVCFLPDAGGQPVIQDTLRELAPDTKVIFLSNAPTFQKISSQTYQISYGNSGQYQEALRQIQADYGKVDAIIYLGAIDHPEYIKDPSPIVLMLQAVAAVNLKPGRIMLAGRYTNGLERCYLESWIGFERSLRMMLPNTRVAVVYHEEPAGQKADLCEWTRLLWPELCNDPIQSSLYREGKRYVCRICPVSGAASTGLQLRTGGTYLLTGGSGGLGLIVAEYLANHSSLKGSLNLILTGRTPLNPEKKAKIALLEARGSRVEYLQVDVADATAMNEQLRRVKERYGPINGVIHAAGIQGKQLLVKNDPAGFHAVLNPKINGALVLDELLRDEPLDFVCYFASSAAILGDFGFCDYAVGNRFLMAYARFREEQRSLGECRGKTVAINWPLWKEGGMTVGGAENNRMYLKSSGQRFLETPEGLAIFDRILGESLAQQLVLVGEPDRIRQFLGAIGPKPVSAAASAKGVPDGKGRKPAMQGQSTVQCLEQDLRELIGQLLMISQAKLDRRANLVDFGFDSLSLGEFATRLTGHFGIEITPALFYGYSTIEKLTEYLLSEHGAAIEAFYREGDPGQEIHQGIAGETGLSNQSAPGPIRYRDAERDYSKVPEPIAIVGMSGRFPGARNIEELWAILVEGREVVKEPPQDRVGMAETQWKCGWIPGVSEFDPQFFEISPKEAQTMDPRQRLLLQEAWNALEDAGYGKNQLQGSKVGIYAGVENGDYQFLTGKNAPITSNHNGVLAGRLAYFMNFSGPNIALNTACSSGLVAMHLACWGLRDAECDVAIVAGVNLMLVPETFAIINQAGMLSKEGKCYAFDQRAGGMVPGEAVAVVVLKRLAQAEADGDSIYAVIRGSGINYDGKTNGITAPSMVSQSQLLKSTYERYGVNPAEIEYVVAHGTGTKLGDPVEVNALQNVFKQYTTKQRYCALTSPKTNLGHTFAASGLVSLISLVQALRYRTIPASLHCEKENEYINWNENAFFVNKANRPWPRPEGRKRLGAVSAFGMSGTNAHLVIESYETQPTDLPASAFPYSLLVFSAKTQTALDAKITSFIGYINGTVIQEVSLTDISYTLLEGRHHFAYRCALVVQDWEEVTRCLHNRHEPQMAHLFSGKVAADFNGQTDLRQTACALLRLCWAERENPPQYRQHLMALADFYCQGYDLPWSQLFGDLRPRRLHLPTYPFARQHYWVEDNRKQSAAAISGADLSVAAAAQEEPWDEKAESKLEGRTDQAIHLQSLSGYTQPMALPVTPGQPGKLKLMDVAPLLPGTRVLAEPVITPSRRVLENLQAELISSLAEALGMEQEQVSGDDKLTDLGLDSIIGVEWVQKVNQRYNVTLTATELYEYPNLRELARFLEREAGVNQLGMDPPGYRPDPTVESFVATAESLRAELVASLTVALAWDQSQIDARTKFSDLGLDSIIGVEWVHALNQRYGTQLEVSLIYNFPNIDAFAEYLARELNHGKQENVMSPLQPLAELSVHDLVLQVEQGSLDIDEAERLLQRLEVK